MECRSNQIKERSEEIFTVEEYDGHLWLFCEEIGVIPCSYLNLKSEDDIMKFLEDVRNFYIKTESKHVKRKDGACRMC